MILIRHGNCFSEKCWHRIIKFVPRTANKFFFYSARLLGTRKTYSLVNYITQRVLGGMKTKKKIKSVITWFPVMLITDMPTVKVNKISRIRHLISLHRSEDSFLRHKSFRKLVELLLIGMKIRRVGTSLSSPSPLFSYNYP